MKQTGLIHAVLLVFLAQLAGAQKAVWEPIGLSGGGAMYMPAISPADPKLMMLNCDMSGAYMSDDGGRTWRMINHLQLRSNTRCRPAFHPLDSKTVFAANGWSGMAVSHDRGEHWKAIGNLEGALIGDIAIDEVNPDNMLAATAKQVYWSSDGGQKWTPSEGPHGEFIGAHFDQTIKTPTCFIATVDGIWRSDDGGAQCRLKTAGLPVGPIRAFAGGSNRSTGKAVLYCAVPGREADGHYTGGIYRSVDRGESWQSAMGTGLNTETKAFDPWAMGPVAQYLCLATTNSDPTRVYACNSNTGVPPPHHASVYRSDDSGANWRAVFQADPRFPGFNAEADYTVAVDGQFYQDVANIAVASRDPNRIVMVNGGSCYATADGGGRWSCGNTRAASAPEGSGPRWTCTGLVVTTTWNYYIDPYDPNRHYICYTDIGFARSMDRGRTWEWWAQKGRAPWQNTCYQLAFDPKVPGKIWGAFSNVHDIPNGNIIWGSHRATGPGGVCVTEDHGATWKPANQGLPVAPTTSVVVDPRSPVERRVLYAGQFGQGVFRSDDGGVTWFAKNNGLGAVGNMRVCRVYLHSDGTLFALVTALMQDRKFIPDGPGIYRSNDRGEHWVRINESQPLLWPKDFTVDPKDSQTIYVGAADARQDQAGLWRTKDGGKHWTRILKEGSEHFGAYLHPRRPGWIYATLTEGAPKAGLWLSKDDGKTWEAIDALPFSNVQRVTFDSSDPSVIYVTTFGGSVWRGPADPDR